MPACRTPHLHLLAIKACPDSDSSQAHVHIELCVALAINENTRFRCPGSLARSQSDKNAALVQYRHPDFRERCHTCRDTMANSPPQWQWDDTRKSWCWWSPDNEFCIYQDGSKFNRDGSAFVEQLLYILLHVLGSLVCTKRLQTCRATLRTKRKSESRSANQQQ